MVSVRLLAWAAVTIAASGCALLDPANRSTPGPAAPPAARRPRPAVTQGLLHVLGGTADALVQRLLPGLGAPGRHVAVFPFACATARCDLGELLANELEGRLAARGVALVERADLHTVRAEQALARRGLTDDVTAAEAGNLKGARIHVRGRLIETADLITANLRAVDTQTGQVVATAVVAMQRTDETSALFAPVAPASPPATAPERQAVTVGAAATPEAAPEPAPRSAGGKPLAFDNRHLAAGPPAEGQADAPSPGGCSLATLDGSYAVVTRLARTGELTEGAWELRRDASGQIAGQSSAGALSGRIDGHRLTLTRPCPGEASGCVETFTGTLRKGVVEGVFARGGVHLGTWRFGLCPAAR